MIILLGSESGQKIEILRNALGNLLKGDFEVIPRRIESGIPEQPLNIAITREGAINRAVRAAETFDKRYDFSFGLEAGLEMIDGLYHFVSLAAIFRPDGDYSVGASSPTPLPRAASECVLKGEYLSDTLREYCAQPGLSSEEKMLVEDLINRKRSFTEAILNAWK